MDWPEHYPEKCPPKRSRSAEGVVFRLMSGKRPTERDFRSYRLQYPTRNFGGKLCIACGVSIYTDLEDVQRLRNRVPAARRKHVCGAELLPEYGKMLLTSSPDEHSHHTWWFPGNVRPWTFFAVVSQPTAS
jgi:hypothetical protein